MDTARVGLASGKLPILANIRLTRKGLIGASTLAYFVAPPMREKNLYDIGN